MPAAKLRVGDLVTFTIGKSKFRARVVEDRGGLGVGGRQIVGIELLRDPTTDEEPRRFEMAAEELVREQPAA